MLVRSVFSFYRSEVSIQYESIHKKNAYFKRFFFFPNSKYFKDNQPNNYIFCVVLKNRHFIKAYNLCALSYYDILNVIKRYFVNTKDSFLVKRRKEARYAVVHYCRRLYWSRCRSNY